MLNIISSAREKNEKLTYSGVATRMGRPQSHSRAMASACNLLDAAACLAGVPLLALVVVLTQLEDINPDAFKTVLDEYQRKTIIERSDLHKFERAEYNAISKALVELGDKGAKKAWSFIHSLYPGNLFYLRLIGNYAAANSNAVDDLGADASDRIRSEVWTYSRDPRVRDAVLRRANGQCEFCGQLGFMKPDGTRYLESHHVIALASDGEDRPTNVIALCPNDHREAHFGNRRQEIEAEMILKLKAMND